MVRSRHATGVSLLQCPRRPALRAPVSALLVSVFLLASATAAEEPDDEARIDPALVSTFETIREAFRTRRTEPLLSILPANAKVYLAVRVIARESGYYSRDQFAALLSRAFATMQTLKFHINVDLSDDAGNLILCPAAWTFMDHGAKVDVNLRFLLARRNGRWTLSEIRETR